MDLISRKAAIDIERNATVDTNPTHFEAHQKFIQFMDDAEISSFGRWQWSNGFNTALTAVGIDLEKLPSAQPDCSDCIKHGGDWDCDHVHCHKGESAQPERKKGKWIPVTNGRGGFECDECHKYAPSFQDGVEWLSDYCPNCGARME